MRIIGLAIVIGLLAVACGGGGSDRAETASPAAPTATEAAAVDEAEGNDGGGGGNGGNGDDDVLHLRGADITRDAYRNHIRGEFLGPLRGICDGLQGLSAEEIVDAVLTTQEGTPEPFEAVGATPVAGQEPDSDSRLGAAEIIGQECERVAGAE